MASLVIIAVIGLIAAVAPVLAPYDPSHLDLDAPLAGPSWTHPLGTDQLGRDTLSRLMHGATTSMGVGVLSQIVVVLIALPVGVVAGMASARVDNLLMRGVDLAFAFPDLLLIILLRSIFGGSFSMMFLAIGLASWPAIARLVRGQILALRQREYVLASRAMGASTRAIVWKHLLPNALGPVVVAVTFLVPRAIFAEASLSYIGIGVGPPNPSWGSMVKEGYDIIFASYRLVLLPIAAIAVVMLAFTFLGDSLRDVMDPRSSRR